MSALRAWIGGVVSATTFGLTPTVAAFAYDGGVSPSVLVLLRSAAAAVLLLVFAASTGRLATISRRDALTLTLVCGPLFGIQLLCFFAAIEITGAQVAVVIAHVSPVFVLIFGAAVLRRRVGGAAWLISAAMVFGVALVAGAGGGSVVASGAALAVACALGYAAYYLIGETLVRRVSIVSATGLTSLGSAASAAVLVIVYPQNWDFTAGGWLSIGIQGAVMVPLGIGGAYLALRTLGSVSGSLLGLLEPIVGVFAALLFLGEYLTWQQWLGVTVVLLASAALPLRNRRDVQGRPART
ncbi:DMT family transporter [Rhodococcoides fascians]|uniref:DMT family transporter n=1 Tax=Rhodococcoides fascians TaxID=1828 RepID=UPI000B32700B|nr:DMT family transporter [Rhodococcus fascians]